MKNRPRFLLLIIIASLLIGALPSTSVLAGSNVASNNQSAGEAKLNQIKGNPCGNGNLHRGDINYVSCSGWAGEESWLTVPLSYWETKPEYLLVNYPFYIGIGTVPVNRPGTNSTYYFPRRDVTYSNQIDIDGLRTEIQLVATKQNHGFINSNFNGTFEYDYSTISFWQGELLNRYHDSVEEDLEVFGQPPEPKSATYLPCYTLENGAADTVVLRAMTTNSSYHATNAATYRGEPAYRIELASYYRVQARVSWQSYRLWIKEQVGWKSVCRPGPNNSGMFNCITPGGQLGHTVDVEVYEWKWGPPQGGGGTDWVNVPTNFSVDSVRWPDGSIHDHMPITVYQSQPILQQP